MKSEIVKNSAEVFEPVVEDVALIKEFKILKREVGGSEYRVVNKYPDHD